MQNILIRTDSSSTIGLGHVMRDLVLAQQFPKGTITFATQNLEGNINNKILEATHKLVILKSNEKKELTELIKKLEINLLIIDHYNITYEIEKHVKEKTGVKIFVLDDTYQQHHCDILLNHNMGANKRKYEKLVPKECVLKCGKKHTLLRREFYQEKDTIKRHNNSKNRKIFIAMGGVDHTNANPHILKALSDFKNLEVNLVTSSANKNLKELQHYAKNKKWIKLHINSNEIAKLMKISDFAVITPSVTANEAVFMELPFIAIKTTKNQNDIYKYLLKKRFKVLKQMHVKKLKKYLRQKLV